MTLSESEKPKGGYYKWKLSKRKDWLHKATQSNKDNFGLRSAYYAGYEYALKQHGILYSENAKELKEKEARDA